MINKSMNKIYKLFAVLAILMAGFSCSDDVFDVPVGERITSDQHYESVEDIDISMLGALVGLQKVLPNMIMVDGLRSDLMDVTPNADIDFQAINDHSFSADNPYLDPSDLYKTIINVNEVLLHIDEVIERDRNFKEDMLFDYTGLLIGLRSWTYLNLVRMYGEVAWIPDNMATLPEGGQQKMMKKEELLDTLINQLTPFIYDAGTGVSRTENYFRGFMNARAVLGELYLEKNEYVLAADFFKKALESYPQVGNIAYKVEKTYESEAWLGIFFSAENNVLENISVIPYELTQGQNNPLADWMFNEYMVKPTNKLMDSMDMQVQVIHPDSIGDLYRGKGITYFYDIDTIFNGNDTILDRQNPLIMKYLIEGSSYYSSDIIVSRAADVHLLMAEALNRAGEHETALLFLNSGISSASLSQRPPGYSKFSTNLGIRGRVKLAPRIVPDSIPEMERMEMIEDLIIWEKAMECAFEGKRMSDLIRVALRRDNPEEYLSNAVSSKFADDPAKAAEIKGKLMNQANWYLPLK